MIENKVIKFGYGSVLATYSDMFRTIDLSHIVPPLEVGQTIDLNSKKDLTILDTIKFKYADDMKVLLEKLSNIEQGNKQIEFREYILDFTNYNVESVNVLKKALSSVIRGWIQALAC